jgi:hypothetical protein
MPYVITEGWKVPESGGAPESIRGFYEDWASWAAAIKGSKGAVRMKVCSREDARAILSGKGIVLEPGLYAFTDGNSSGGVGVAIVRMGDEQDAEPQVEQRIPTSVHQIFRGSKIPGLESDQAVSDALQRITMHLSELAAVYLAVGTVPPDTDMTIVYDRESVGPLMKRPSKSKKPEGALISESQKLAKEKRLGLTYKHQCAHGSTWAGRLDFVKYNTLADDLAEEGSNNFAANGV